MKKSSVSTSLTSRTRCWGTPDQLIRQKVDETHPQGKPLAVCGELAADPVAGPVLVGLGADELSPASPAIPRAKALICNLAHAKAVLHWLKKYWRPTTPAAWRRSFTKTKYPP